MQDQLINTQKVSETIPLQLKWCRTFIDIGEEGFSTDSSSSKRRSKSEPAHQKLAEDPAELFGGERAYIASLASKLVCFREHYKSSSTAHSTTSTRSQGSSEKNSAASFCTLSVSSLNSDMDSLVLSPPTPSAPSQMRPVQQPGVVFEIEQLLRESTDGLDDVDANELVAHSLLRAKAQSCPRSASSVEAATEVELPDPAQDLMLPLSTSQVCNPGSLGHPELCMRPCIYFASGGCSNGECCEYCHMGHPKRPVHLDKRHRELLRGMSVKDSAALMHPVVRNKVADLQSSSTVDELLDELAMKCGCDPASREPVAANRQQRMLVTTLQSMSLRSLLTTFGRVISDACTDGEAVIEDIVQQLRSGLTA
mmetsp:Transcript_14925/g.32931  ORF Transcript_14925/g.32931 Transcript_14925/m.32931 type:complete len:367 (-) Transcript_14925:171-1271(-)